MNRFILLYCFLLTSILLSAQDSLSLEQALRKALENNYGIQASQLDAMLAKNNATAGNAGLLPSLSLDARANYNLNNSNVTFASGEKRSVTGLSTDNQNAGLTINYPLAGIIVGLANLDRLRTLSEQSEIQSRANVEAQLSQTVAAFYNLARQQRALDIAGQALTVSRDRLKRLSTQREFGGASRLAVLNAEVNYNADSVSLLNTRLARNNAMRNLQTLLGEDPDMEVVVQEPVAFAGATQLEAAMANAEAQNTALQLASYNEKISEYNLMIARAAQLPNLNLSLGYSFSRSYNGPISFASNTNGNGLAASANFNWNLFNGGQVKTQIQNQEVSLQAAKLRYEETKLNLFRDLKNAIANYRSGLEVIDLQEISLEAARLNFTQTEERFKLGQATGTQFREAQLNLLQVQNQLNNLRYDTKVVEMELLRLVGELY
ncbi:MAG: TolC family protein [Bacteroidia bacterium]